MTTKDMLHGNKARKQIALGLDALANAVKVTLGPRGRNVLLEKSWGSPLVTKDGATVAKEIDLSDRFANLGAQMVKEVAAKAAEVTGDGTTTATVLAQALYSEGAKLVEAGVNPMELKRGIDRAVEVVVADLERQSKPTRSRTEIAQVSVISANGDAVLGNLIAEAMTRVGAEGVVTIEEGKSVETSLEVVDGMRIDRGYLSPYFVTDPVRMEATLQEAFVLLHERRISTMQPLLPLLEQVAKLERPLLIIAEDIDGEALAALLVNKLRGTLQVCATKAPSYGDHRRELLEDIAVLVGGQVVAEALGLELESLTLEDLGVARTVKVGKEHTTVVGGGGSKEKIQARVRQLRAQLDEATSEHERERLKSRLARLTGGVAVIKIGATTELEMKEKKARAEDALHATLAAAEEGIVPGGGVALLRASRALDGLALPGEQRFGVQVVRRALEEPLRQLAQNGGAEGAVIVEKVREGEGAYGYNVASGEYEDLVLAGVIDPTKVVRVALESAASVASVMLSTQVLIAGQAGSEAS